MKCKRTCDWCKTNGKASRATATTCPTTYRRPICDCTTTYRSPICDCKVVGLPIGPALGRSVLKVSRMYCDHLDRTTSPTTIVRLVSQSCKPYPRSLKLQVVALKFRTWPEDLATIVLGRGTIPDYDSPNFLVVCGFYIDRSESVTEAYRKIKTKGE